MIIRQQYLDRLVAYRNKPVIKIITGMRRCGKSNIMTLFQNYLLEDDVPKENIIKMSFEMMEFDEIVDYRDLYKYIKSKLPNNGRSYLLLDEVQMVKNWEKAISSLYAEDAVDIYLTGSNSFLLSSDIATLLSGRYVMIKVFPLSFQEYLQFMLRHRQEEDHQYNSLRRMPRSFVNQEEDNLVSDLKRYIRYGGLPSIPFLPQDRGLVQEYLEGVYNSVIIKDVLMNRSICDITALKKVVRYVARNTGNIISPSIISNYLSFRYQNDNYEEATIFEYMLMLEKAYIFHKIDYFDIKTNEIIPNLNKYYLADSGIRNMVMSFSDAGKGHNLETIVYFELLRRGYEVFCGRYDNQEIDFYVARQEERKCLQVSVSLEDKEVRERKISALKAIPNNCEKIIISMDQNYEISSEGIIFMNFADFLLDNDLCEVKP